MIQGSCLGYAVESPVAFELLRLDQEGMPLVVEEWDPPPEPEAGAELVVRWRPRPDRPFHGEVWRRPDGQLVVDTSDAGWFTVDTDPLRVQIPRRSPALAREVRLWTTPMLLLATISGATPLHAACISTGDRAVAISAPGGHGKTTLAAHLAARGHALLAEDITICDGEEHRVRVGPDLLRLRPPSVGKVGLGSGAEVLEETPERVFVRTNRPAYPVPLAAVVFLKQGDDARLTRRTDPARLADLWQVSFHLPELADRRRSFESVAAIADNVPVYDLTRPLDWSHLEASADLVEQAAAT